MGWALHTLFHQLQPNTYIYNRYPKIYGGARTHQRVWVRHQCLVGSVPRRVLVQLKASLALAVPGAGAGVFTRAQHIALPLPFAGQLTSQPVVSAAHVPCKAGGCFVCTDCMQVLRASPDQVQMGSYRLEPMISVHGAACVVQPVKQAGCDCTCLAVCPTYKAGGASLELQDFSLQGHLHLPLQRSLTTGADESQCMPLGAAYGKPASDAL